jgi:type III restriction enzyme
LYCKTVTEYTTANQGKPWKYVLIPHTVVLANMSFDTLMKRFEVRDI